MKPPDPIGLALQNAREDAGFAVDDVVVKTGIGRDRLFDLEGNVAMPDASEIAELAGLYEVAADELLGMDTYRRYVDELGRQLLDARLRCRLSIADVVRQVSIGERRLRAIEEGRVEPFSDEAAELARIYVVSLDAIARTTIDAVAKAEPEESSEATGGSPVVANMGTQTPASTETTAATRRPRHRRVAAIIVIGLLLTGAGIVGKQLIWPNRFEPVMKSLDYQRAILVALDPQEDDNSRRRALLRALKSLHTSLNTLKELIASTAGGDSQRISAMLKAVAEHDRAGLVPTDLRNRVLALRADLDQLTQEQLAGIDRCSEIETQLVLGLLALNKLADGRGSVKESADVCLKRVRRLLRSNS